MSLLTAAAAIGLASLAAVAIVSGTVARGADDAASARAAQQPARMLATEEMVRRKFSGVLHLSSEDLVRRTSEGTDVLLFDVREEEEYAVSHLANSIRVAPGIGTDQFLARHASSVRGKTIIFYCSVGMRSSELAQRVQNALFAAGAERIYNLNGGIFHWHNEARELVNGKGATSLVHEYDAYWGRLVRRRELAVRDPK